MALLTEDDLDQADGQQGSPARDPDLDRLNGLIAKYQPAPKDDPDIARLNGLITKYQKPALTMQSDPVDVAAAAMHADPAAFDAVSRQAEDAAKRRGKRPDLGNALVTLANSAPSALASPDADPDLAKVNAILAGQTPKRPTYAEMAGQLKAKPAAFNEQALLGSPFTFSGTQPIAPGEPTREPSGVAAANAGPAVKVSVAPRPAPASSPFTQDAAALASPPPAPASPPSTYTRIDPRTGATLHIPVDSAPLLDAVSGVLQAGSGAFAAVPTAIGETMADQSLPGHEGEPNSVLGRLTSHAKMILSGHGGNVTPLSVTSSNPPDTVEMPSAAETALRGQLGLPPTAPRARGPKELATIDVAQRGMDMLAKIATDPTAVAAGGVEGLGGDILASAFTADGIHTAVKVAADPNATPADVATALLGVGIQTLPLTARAVRATARGAANMTDAAVAATAERMRAAILATNLRAPNLAESVQRGASAGVHAPIAAMENIGGMEHPAPVGETIGEAVRTALAPEPPALELNQGRDRAVPAAETAAPEDARLAQEPPTVVPPVAVRPGEGAVGPVAPSPEPSPDASAVPSPEAPSAVPADPVQQDKLARTIFDSLQAAGHDVKWKGDQLMVDGRPYVVGPPPTAPATVAPGPEFVPVGHEPPVAPPSAVQPPQENVLDRVTAKLANGEQLGTDEARAALEERTRVEAARQGAADTLSTGEVQPRLPGDVGDVRNQEIPTPKEEAPFSLTPEIATRTAVQPGLLGAADDPDLARVNAILKEHDHAVPIEKPGESRLRGVSGTGNEGPGQAVGQGNAGPVGTAATRPETSNQTPAASDAAPETLEPRTSSVRAVSKGYDNLNPHERRELGRMLAELQDNQFTKHTFNPVQIGRGGAYDIVPGAGGAPVFHDIGAGTRAAAAEAIARVLNGKRPTAVGKRAIDVARMRLNDDKRVSKPLYPEGPGSWDEPGRTYVDSTRDMTAAEAAVERPFREAVENKTPQMVKAYRKRFGNVVSSDHAKELSPEYAASIQAKAQFNRAVHRASSALADATYQTMIKEAPPKGKDPDVVFVAGATGVGKSTVIDSPGFKEPIADAQIIVDGPLSNTGNAQRRIQMALDAGKRVSILYVHQNPVHAWQGVVTRGATIGRQPSQDYHIASHVNSLRTIHQLADIYAGDPRVGIEYVNNPRGQEPHLIDRSKLPQAYNEEDVRSEIAAAGHAATTGAAAPVASPAEIPRPGESGSREERPAGSQGPAASAEAVAPAHEFSSTQVELPPSHAAAIRRLAESIPTADLAKDGREDKPHVTVKFGLHTDDVADVRRVLAGEAPIRLTLGKTSVFPASETGKDYDVVKVAVNSPDLHRLNAKLAGALEHTDTHPEYKPHATIAYVKAGLGKKYAGRTDLEGQSATLNAVTFSDKNRQHVSIPLEGRADVPVTPRKLAQSSTSAPSRGAVPVTDRGTTLQATVLPGAKEFVEQDIVPAVQAAAEQVNAARQDIRTLFAPDTLGDAARLFADVMRSGLASHAQRVQRAQRAFRALEKIFDRRSNAENLAFIDAIEGGAIDDLKTADERRAAQQLRDLLDGKRQEVRQRGKLQTYIDNYFPHEWKQPTKAKDLIRRIMGRRPLQGPKSFLKKRSIPTVKEGIAAGLEPASYNPVTLVLHKFTEMDKWIMAHDVLKDAKALGVAKFVRAGWEAPKDWQRYHDSFGTVYAPPFVKVEEAFDARLMEKLHAFATSLGIQTVRKVKIAQKGSGVGGNAWGYAVANPADGSNARIATKFGGPETVLEHEIGHILDWKYGLWDKIKKELDEERFDPQERHPAHELRDLADRRFEGEDSKDVKSSFKSYVRKKEEKIANLVHAFIYNPQMAKDVAPNAYWALYNLAKDNPELTPLIDLQKTKSLVLGTSTAEKRVDGMVIGGHYWGPAEAVRILNNYLAPGLRGNAAFDAYRIAGNFMNQVQLGLSGFHLGMTGIEAVVSKVAQGFEELSRGEGLHAAKSLAEAPIATFSTLYKGNKAMEALYAKDANMRTLEGVTDLVTQAGGGVNRDKTLKIFDDRVESMMKAFRQGNILGGAMRVPLAAIELPTKFIMEWWVPRLKLGAYLDLARMELRTLGPEPELAEVRRVLGRAWDSIDNRFGQLVYDNLFWKNAQKDLGMGAFRALGWNIGTSREVFGAPTSQIGQFKASATGSSGGPYRAKRLMNTGRDGEGRRQFAETREPWMTHKTAYVAALSMVIGLMGALYQYTHAGEGPKELRDYFFPRTGRKRPDGKDERVSFPSYFKDVYGVFHDFPTSAGQTIGHKLQPLLNLAYEILTNEDFYGTEIRNRDDSVLDQMQQVGKHVVTSTMPFTLQSFQQRTADRGSKGASALESFFGVTPASSTVYRTKAEDLVRRYLPPSVHTAAGNEKAEEARQLREGIRIGGADGKGQAQAAVATGLLSRRQVQNAVRGAGMTPLQAGFQHLTLEQALNVYDVATPSERATLRSLLERNAVSGLQNAAPDDVDYLREKVKRAVALPVAGLRNGVIPVTPRATVGSR